MPELPNAYKEQMRTLLGEADYRAFMRAYTKSPVRGLRTNTLKVSPSELKEMVPFHLKPVEWCPAGFYYSSKDSPGKHPYHDAGLYYIQEPSAMAVVEQLDPQPGERVLDLCAAPGGKSTQIAAKMGGQGWLISNEIHSQRVNVLTENLERCGVCNATVLNESPQRLASRFTAFFDRILVDAPCSGEGMFRKNPDAVNEWSHQHVLGCTRRQREILDAAIPMLRPGGRLVYSTCTFNTRENEEIVDYLLHTFPDLTLQKAQNHRHFTPGIARETRARTLNEHVARLWPHQLEGEGHFIAVFKKQGDADSPAKETGYPKAALSADLLEKWRTFERDTLTAPLSEKRRIVFGSHLYDIPPDLPDLRGIRVKRPGLYLGEFKKNRFEPSHALAMALTKQNARLVTFLSSKRIGDVAAYLRGETVTAKSSQKGWTLVTVDGFPLGWGKQVGTVVKNHLPKRLRRHVDSY